MNVTVDMADWAVTRNPRVTLVTYSLGSCIGMTIWDPGARVGGMIHYMLPDDALAPDKARIRPAMFGTTGIPAMFRKAYALGASKDRLTVKVAGGAQPLVDKGMFGIGKHNYRILRQILRKNGISVDAEDVGGTCARTMRLYMADGRVTIKTIAVEREL